MKTMLDIIHDDYVGMTPEQQNAFDTWITSMAKKIEEQLNKGVADLNAGRDASLFIQTLTKVSKN